MLFACVSDVSDEFQSTHPLRGATGIEAGWGIEAGISIHAPLAGCDVFWTVFTEAWRYFNPRTPCGVRLPV